MSDETAQVEQPAAPAPESVEAALEAAVTAETPAPAFDPESFKSSLTADLRKEFETTLNERVKGFQKIVSERDREIQRLRQPPSDDDETDERDAQIAALSRKAWILEKRTENSAVADVLLAFSDAADAEEQFKVLADFAASLTPPPSETKEEPEAEEQVAAVDLNNPLPGADEDVTVLSNGTRLTKQIEDRVLKSMSRMPGH